MNKNNILSSLAYIVIIVMGLKLSSGIVLPFLMAVFLFIIFYPLINRLNKFGLPNIITSLIVFVIIVVSLFLLGVFLTTSSDEIVKNISIYQEKFYQVTPQIVAFFEKHNISLEWNSIISLIEPIKIVNYITIFFKGMGNIVISTFLTLILVIFLLLESSVISQKTLYFTKTEQQKEKLQLFLKSINRYFIIKTFTSALTSLLIWAVLEYFNLQYASLFAVLAFLLNYIPSIGSFIAAFPALFVAILQLNIVDTVIIAFAYLIINILIGNFLDPKIMGKDLGLSTFMVFVSMVIWGWIFGPIGMFLAVPLTIAIKIACENSKNYHWVAILLKDSVIKNIKKVGDDNAS